MNEIASDLELEIWEAVRRGDRRGALTRLMSNYGQRVYAFCFSMVRSREMADDIHQIVFTQAYEGLADLREQPAFRPWLLAIARNRCLDELKKKRRFLARMQPTAELPDVVGAEPAPDASLQRLQEIQIVARCIDALTPQIRTLVLLHYQEEMTYADLARICREPSARLQKRVVRSLEALRRCVGRAEA